jgi:hypothetical protein
MRNLADWWRAMSNGVSAGRCSCSKIEIVVRLTSSVLIRLKVDSIPQHRLAVHASQRDGSGLTMATYDSKVIYRFAEELYARADAIVGQAVIIAALLGIVLVAAARVLVPKEMILTVLAVAGSVVVGWSMYKSAERQAFKLRLEAQMALCEVRIEENTRSLVGRHSREPVPATDSPSRLAS